MKVVTLFLFVIVFNKTTCRPVFSGAPTCAVRGGREYVITFKRPTQMPNTSIAHNLYLEWSTSGMIKRGSEPCWHLLSTDQIKCPTTWSLFNKKIMNSSMKVHVIDTTTKKIIWENSYTFKPYKHLFDCFTNINVRNLKTSESLTANKWILSWRPLYWSKRFYKPSFQITINNKHIDSVNIRQCNHGYGRECQIELPDDLRTKKDLELCVKSIFVLDSKKNYHTSTTKTVKHCTVSTLSSQYRLKVINVVTGEEVVDYGLWHHPQGEKLNRTVLLEIKNTKTKVYNVYNKTIEESSIKSKNR